MANALERPVEADRLGEASMFGPWERMLMFGSRGGTLMFDP